MKRFAAAVLALAVLLCAVPAASAQESSAGEAADVLHALGLFQGIQTGGDGTPDYALDRTVTRDEAVTMLVRLLGKEQEALEGSWTTPFTDVERGGWAEPYVGYAYGQGLAAGTSETAFSGGAVISAAECVTLYLRALGYVSGTDFQWNEPWSLSDAAGLTRGQQDGENGAEFTRGDMAELSLSALATLMKDQKMSLAARLIEEGALEEDLLLSVMDSSAFADSCFRQMKSVRYQYARINGKLYRLQLSAASGEPGSNEIWYERWNPSAAYLDSTAANGMLYSTVTLSLLTGSCVTREGNPGVIDMTATFFDGDTIDIESEKSGTGFARTHIWEGKKLTIPAEVQHASRFDTARRTAGGIACTGRFLNLADYCRYFGLDVQTALEYDSSLSQFVLSVTYGSGPDTPEEQPESDT